MLTVNSGSLCDALFLEALLKLSKQVPTTTSTSDWNAWHTGRNTGLEVVISSTLTNIRMRRVPW